MFDWNSQADSSLITVLLDRACASTSLGPRARDLRLILQFRLVIDAPFRSLSLRAQDLNPLPSMPAFESLVAHQVSSFPFPKSNLSFTYVHVYIYVPDMRFLEIYRNLTAGAFTPSYPLPARFLSSSSVYNPYSTSPSGGYLGFRT